jgi:AraC family transcriptional regulator
MLNADPCAPAVELVSRINAHEDRLLMHLIFALQAYVDGGALADRMFAASLLAAMAARLLASYGTLATRRPQPTALPRWKRVRIEQYVQDQLAHPISLAEIALTVEMSPHHLCRTFRATTGQSLWQFVLEQRVRKAMCMIGARSAPPLGYVASACGFESYSQFIAAFKKFAGCLPSRYRLIIER